MRLFPAIAVLWVFASPPAAQATAAASDASKLDAAIMAGHVTIVGSPGALLITKSSTAHCKTHLVSAKDAWTIEWTTASIAGDSTRRDLMVAMGPDMEMALTFGNTAQLPTAKAAANHLAAACQR